MRLAVFISAMVISLSLPIQIHGQTSLTRSEIYDQWDSLNLIEKTGDGNLTWLPDEMGYLESEVDSSSGHHTFDKVNPDNRKRTSLFDDKTISNIVSEYNRLTSKTTSGLLFETFTYLIDNRGIRFSVGDTEFVYWFEDQKLQQLIKPKSEIAGWRPHRSSNQLLTGAYAPDFSKIAYVKAYDLYVLDAASGAEEQLTFGGTEEIMNARTDWVYPEELRQSEAFWWAPDGNKIAYLQFDVRAEHEYPLLHEINLEEEGSDHYRFKTLLEIERYPKAGEANPTVKLFILDLSTKKKVEVNTDSSPDVYLVKMGWRADSSELTFQRLNRFQNRLELLAANPSTGDIRTILVEEDTAFVRLHNNYRPLQDGRHFTWTSERTGWNHLYMYDFDGNLTNQLTDGPWEVAGIQRLDEKNKWIYFSTNTRNGLETHFSRVKFDGTDFEQLTTVEGTHRVSIDPAGKFFTDRYSSLTTPEKIDLVKSNGDVIRNLSTTTLDTARMKELGLSLPELVFFKAADGITDLHAILYNPAQFDPDKKHPLLITVYGGPSAGVRNAFVLGNRTAQLGYFVLKQDNRGTTNRGKKYLTETYLKFGQVEIDDQAAGVRQITQRPYIDGDRVGMFGGSYGGYSTCMSLLRYPDLYHVGVARAPVTDWRSYDTIYTERYMRTPQANPEGYRLGSAMTYAENLKGKLLIVHGLVDNNVNLGNTIHLSDAFQKYGKMFDLMIYPENRHGIRGYHRDHLNMLQRTYFLKNLKPEHWEDRLGNNAAGSKL